MATKIIITSVNYAAKSKLRNAIIDTEVIPQSVNDLSKYKTEIVFNSLSDAQQALSLANEKFKSIPLLAQFRQFIPDQSLAYSDEATAVIHSKQPTT